MAIENNIAVSIIRQEWPMQMTIILQSSEPHVPHIDGTTVCFL